MEPDDRSVSRNARLQNDAQEQAHRSSCSQSPHDKAVVARCAQWRTICLLLLGKSKTQKPSIGNKRVILVYVRPLNEALLWARVPGTHRLTWVSFHSCSSSTSLLLSGRHLYERVQVAPLLREANDGLPSLNIPQGVGRLPFTARVQRGPSEAARCASKKGGLPTPC